MQFENGQPMCGTSHLKQEIYKWESKTLIMQTGTYFSTLRLHWFAKLYHMVSLEAVQASFRTLKMEKFQIFKKTQNSVENVGKSQEEWDLEYHQIIPAFNVDFALQKNAVTADMEELDIKPFEVKQEAISKVLHTVFVTQLGILIKIKYLTML